MPRRALLWPRNLRESPHESAIRSDGLEVVAIVASAHAHEPTKEMTTSDRTGLPPDVAPLVADLRYFTAWHGAQLAYWDDSGLHNPKTPDNEPDEFGPLSRVSICSLLLHSGAVVLGSVGPGSDCAQPFDVMAGRAAALDDAITKARNHFSTTP